jgi:hypothetical protein
VAKVHENEHSACVNAWLERAARGLPPERLLQIFEQGFAALWRRAHQTLGDVTLTAIVDRVLYTAAERFPLLAGLKINANGIHCEEIRAGAGSLHHDELAQGIRFVLIEFLTVLGNLTAEILTPALHLELSKVALENTAPAMLPPLGEPQNSEFSGEESEP